MSPIDLNSDMMYRLLVQSVVDYAIYLLSPEGVVTNWNAGAQRAKGYRAAEIVDDATLKIYEGGGHGLAQLQAEEFNNDVLAFIRG